MRRGLVQQVSASWPNSRTLIASAKMSAENHGSQAERKARLNSIEGLCADRRIAIGQYVSGNRKRLPEPYPVGAFRA